QVSRDFALDPQACPTCGARGHLPDGEFCRRCGSALQPLDNTDAIK
ncbi:MAG: ion transporter, partial [Gemmatimonadota bacterium]|nr:ion transporter [Gemmatimonadota bacterium]